MNKLQIIKLKDMDVPYVIKSGAPSASDNSYSIPTMWIDITGDAFYILTDVTGGTATWSTGGSSLPVVDTTSLVKDPVTDSKQMRIDVGAISDSTVRVLTMPNQNIDLTPTTGTFAATSHASTHTSGADDIQSATAAQKGLMTLAYASKLDGIETGADVMANTVTAKTENYVVLAADLKGNIVFTNTGGSGEINFTLPAGAANYRVSFLVTVAQYLKVTANGAEKFRWKTTQGAAGGYIRANAIGTHFEILWSGTEWVIINLTSDLLYDE